MQTGKALDEEQKILYTTKPSVEKSLADLKAILTAFEEVAKEVCTFILGRREYINLTNTLI